MMNLFRMLAPLCGALTLAAAMTPQAMAGCGGVGQAAVKPMSWQSQSAGARLLRVSGREAGIIGFWHVKFVSKGSKGVPDGADVDAGYSQWHSDGTEIMNSGHFSPLNSNFCLGVWKQVGECKYKLNHFATYWDSQTNMLVGPARIQEEVSLAEDGKTFEGTFAIDQYDEAGNSLGHLQGIITGTRIEVDTPATSIF